MPLPKSKHYYGVNVMLWYVDIGNCDKCWQRSLWLSYDNFFCRLTAVFCYITNFYTLRSLSYVSSMISIRYWFQFAILSIRNGSKYAVSRVSKYTIYWYDFLLYTYDVMVMCLTIVAFICMLPIRMPIK